MIVNAGLNQTRNWMAGDSINHPDYIAVGTGTTAPQPTDTALQNEIVRNDATEIKGAAGIVTYQITIGTTQGNGNTITESGVFDQASGGTMTLRSVFSGIDKTSDIEVKIEHEVKCERG